MGEDALAKVREIQDRRWEASLLYALAQLLLELHQNGAAWEYAFQALEFYEKYGDDDLAADTRLHVLVPLHLAKKDFDEALRTASSALRYYQKSGDEKSE